MTVVAIGPERDVPSWNWVGFDTARELSKYYTTATFKGSDVPPCDVMIVVKQPLPLAAVRAHRERGTRVIYLPIDYYTDVCQIRADTELLREYDLVLSHSERLIPHLEPHNPRTRLVEHNNKYALPQVAGYKEAGYVLWVGGCQYIPFLIAWLKRHPLDREVRLLADIETKRARHAAKMLAHELGVPFYMTDTQVNEYEVFNWDERTQFEMMSECKAAIDIKGQNAGSVLDFNQCTKPPTKAQKYVASGIPFAINADSSPAEYFGGRGFRLATPTDVRRWFSREYWEETGRNAEWLRRDTSIEAVGRKFKQYIDSIL